MCPGSRGSLSEGEPLEYYDKHVRQVRLPKLDIFLGTLMFLTIATIPIIHTDTHTH